tara:strand:- start:609 stop:1367 length:759 start_codon:yes stop_codon:yes gene_type:complete
MNNQDEVRQCFLSIDLLGKLRETDIDDMVRSGSLDVPRIFDYDPYIMDRWLNLRDGPGVDRMINLIRAYGPTLSQIDFGGRVITDAIVIALARFCPNLRIVCIGASNLNPMVTDDPVIALAKACPNLREIRLENLIQLSNRSLIALATHCPGLSVVSVLGCYGITDASTVVLAKSCRGLEVFVFDYPYVGDKTLVALEKHCLCLKFIDFRSMEDLSEVGQHLIDRIRIRPKAPSLPDLWWILDDVQCKGQMN